VTGSGFDSHALDQLTIDDLRETGSRRWAGADDGEIASALAEMDLGLAPAIHNRVSAMRRYGYVTPVELTDIGAACAEWLTEAQNWQVAPERIAVIPDVITAVEMLVKWTTDPTDTVIASTPIYTPLLTAARQAGRQVVEVPLHLNGRLDLDEIEKVLRGGARLVLLCHPLNPTGAVFDSHDLTNLSTLVQKYNARVISDEVYAPLTRAPHRSYASLSEQASAQTITIVSASKTWNLSGLKCAQIIFGREEERNTWRRDHPRLEGAVPLLGAVASTAAYRFGEPWRRDMLSYLMRADRVFTKAGHSMPAAGFCAWLRLQEGVSVNTLRHDARVIAAAGEGFGAPGWARFTLGTPIPIVREILDRVSPFLAGPDTSVSAQESERIIGSNPIFLPASPIEEADSCV
jgi:cystathionine beta-lyase